MTFFTEHSMLVLSFIGLLVGMYIAWKRRIKVGLDSLAKYFGYVFVAMSTGFAGMKLLGAFEGVLLDHDPCFRIYGALLIEPLFILLYGKLTHLNLKSLFDMHTIATLPVMFFGRMSCFVTNCCKGIIAFETFRWPTREMELILDVILFIVFLKNEKMNKLNGFLYPILMITYGIFRFATEFLRTGQVIFGNFHIAHIWSILCLIIGYSIYSELRIQDELKRKGKK